MKPILFLDVDGVLNALHRKVNEFKETFSDFRPEIIDVRGRFKWVQQDTLELMISEEMSKRIRELPVDIIWATTWNEKDSANELISPLVGLPQDLPTIGYKPRWRGWWKFPLVQEVVEKEGRPFIWLDDDLYLEQEAIDWVQGIEERVPNFSLVPLPTQGILPQAIDKIEEWIQEIS